MKVTVVTVTYGERYVYLKQVIESSFEQGVDEVVIVSNGSEKTLEKIKELQKTNSKLKLVIINYNSGSANGFHKGIEYACINGAEYIWLLDDDNKPKKNSLRVLKEEWQNLINKNTDESLALLSYRKDRKIYSDAINLGKPRLMLGTNNSFLGFNLFDKIRIFFIKKKNIEPKDKEKGVVSVAPYGGLFFHKNLISEIGLPDISYFLYGDDYDFTYRITKNKGKIFLLKKSEIIDLETSFHLIKNKKFNTRYFNTNSKDRIFYSVRNGIVFEQIFVTNFLIYFINAGFYLLTIFMILLCYPKHLWKFKHIIKGIYSAIQKKQ